MPEVLILNTDDCCYGVLRVRARLKPASRHLDNLGGHSGGDTPLPIPNREVKPASADGTRGASPRESRTPPSFSAGRKPATRGFPNRSESLKASAVAAASPAHPRRRVRRLLDLLGWSSATATSCCGPGRRTTSTRSSPAATTPRSRAGSRRSRIRTPRRTRSRSSAARWRRPTTRLAIEVDRAVVGGIGMGVERARLPRSNRVLDGGLGEGSGYLHARAAASCAPRTRRISSCSASTSITDPDNVALSARRREGRLSARRRSPRASPPPGRAHPRLGDVLAATRRASRVTTPERGRSGRLRARADGGRAGRVVGAS